MERFCPISIGPDKHHKPNENPFMEPTEIPILSGIQLNIGRSHPLQFKDLPYPIFFIHLVILTGVFILMNRKS